MSLRLRQGIQAVLWRGDGELSARAGHLSTSGSAIKAAIQTGKQKIDVGYEPGSAVVNACGDSCYYFVTFFRV